MSRSLYPSVVDTVYFTPSSLSQTTSSRTR